MMHPKTSLQPPGSFYLSACVCMFMGKRACAVWRPEDNPKCLSPWRQGLIVVEVTDSARLADWPLRPRDLLVGPIVEPQVYSNTPNIFFSHGFWGSKSGPCACKASILLIFEFLSHRFKMSALSFPVCCAEYFVCIRNADA